MKNLDESWNIPKNTHTTTPPIISTPKEQTHKNPYTNPIQRLWKEVMFFQINPAWQHLFCLIGGWVPCGMVKSVWRRGGGFGA